VRVAGKRALALLRAMKPSQAAVRTLLAQAAASVGSRLEAVKQFVFATRLSLRLAVNLGWRLPVQQGILRQQTPAHCAGVCWIWRLSHLPAALATTGNGQALGRVAGGKPPGEEQHGRSR